MDNAKAICLPCRGGVSAPPAGMDNAKSVCLPCRGGVLPLHNAGIFPSGLPAAGNRNGSSLNNAGSNGNYWSSTPNSSNTDNAYELNFNSGNHNTDWNNRYNGQSVRPVSELTHFRKLSYPSLFILSAPEKCSITFPRGDLSRRRRFKPRVTPMSSGIKFLLDKHCLRQSKATFFFI